MEGFLDLHPLDFELLAAQLLEAPLDGYARSGVRQNQALAANLASLRRMAPTVSRAFSRTPFQNRQVLGTALTNAAIVAPMGLHGLFHPDGEMATAAGAVDAGTVLTVSSDPSWSAAELMRAFPRLLLWQQIYNCVDRERVAAIISAAEDAGAKAIIATVDAPLALPRGPTNLGFHEPPGV